MVTPFSEQKVVEWRHSYPGSPGQNLLIFAHILLPPQRDVWASRSAVPPTCTGEGVFEGVTEKLALIEQKQQWKASNSGRHLQNPLE